ncbi:hypothetical protein [Robertmurraya siralis]|uniref:hypothetical protein n=1 Tax=Robertmurraya siralis TaxID=77777 RepID=UPI0010F4CE9C|nr:hypothetical protein [Robertmurraya siralis]
MPLDNTASIKDIITSLQNLEGINAKAELASVIGSPVTDEDTMSTMVNQIQTSKNELAGKVGEGAEGTDPLQTLVDKVVVGKKWAKGIVTSSSERLSFYYGSGTSTSSYFVEINGLDFIPSKIEVIREGSHVVNYNSDGYRNDLPNFKITLQDLSALSSNSNLIQGFALLGNAYVDSGGFRLPVRHENVQYRWYAYG